MKQIIRIICSTGVLVASMTLADAQATRTWVSGVGDDANPCSRTAPCITWAGAISKTAAGGEISALDPGGFGAVTITKAITLNGDGDLASVLATGTNGINVQAGATDVVIIRGLSLNGIAGGLNGISYTSGGTLVVENCRIYSWIQSGIAVALGANNGNLIVKNTTITGIPGTTIAGVTVAGTGKVNASLTNVGIRGATTGVDAQAGLTDVDGSVIAVNSGFGVLAEMTGTLSIENSVITSNGIAVQANGAAATVRLSNNDVHDNQLGFTCASGGTLITAGNNRKASNTGGIGTVCTPAVGITIQ